MDIKYLYSIIELYFKNEKKNYKTNLNIKKNDDQILFSFNMNETDTEKTSFSLPYDDVIREISKVLDIYKQNMLIIKEEYFNKNNPQYRVVLQNGRVLSFDGFSVLEINNLRNALYNITIDKEEIRLDKINSERKMAYNPNYRLAQAGFTSYYTLFLVALYLTDAFLIALWVFKLIIK